MSSSNLSLQTKAKTICELLKRHYGNIISSRHLPPLDELILTILSQNTNDRNADSAFEQLKSTYKTWHDVMIAPLHELSMVIKPAGAFRVKAKRIKKTLSEIKKRVGSLDLSLLKDMPLAEAKRWLTSLYGVGPKTAAIVLLFSFGRPALPVDTHVWRVTRRLGLISKKTSRDQAHTLLENLIPKDCIYSMNHNLVQHGRQICRSRKPLCDVCFLRKFCDYHFERVINYNRSSCT